MSQPRRARNAVCERCSYQMSGAEIHDDTIVCPECGHLNALSFERTRSSWRRERIGQSILILGVPCAAFTAFGWLAYGATGAGVMLVSFAGAMMLLRLFRPRPV